MIRYVLLNISRNVFRSLSFFFVAFILMSALCFLQIAIVRQEKELRSVYEDITVTVTVTDNQGNTDNLYIPTDYIETFTGNTHELFDYVNHVSLKRSMLLLNEDIDMLFNAELKENKEKAKLIGISNLASDDSLLEINGVTVSFFNGYDESILRGDEPVCLINERFYNALNSDNEYITITAKSSDYIFAVHKPEDVEMDMKIVGVVRGGKPYHVYCSWKSICRMGSLSDGSDPYAESMSGIIADNKRLNEFKEKAKRYYTKVDITMDESENSLALIVHDSQLRNTSASIYRNNQIIKLAISIILLFSLGIGFFVCFLCTRNRCIELALLRSLGMRKVRVLRLALTEQLILSTIALFMSFTFLIVSNEKDIGFPYNIIFFLSFMSGSVMSMYRRLSSNILKNLQSAE